jgi:adenine deaminase
MLPMDRVKPWESLLKAALGQRRADLVIRDVTVVNVDTGELIPNANISVCQGFFADVGPPPSIGRETIEVNGRGGYAVPGLLDGHVHVESSMLSLTNFSIAALRRGTTGIFIDPHEIANVLGRRGVELLIRESAHLPVKVYFLVPSCVPAVPGMETSGASLTSRDVRSLLGQEPVVGLAEVMNYPAVASGDRKLLSEIKAALGLRKVVDGHYTGRGGRELAAYVSTGVSSCHESVSRWQALEKARYGMYLMVREGTAWRDLSEVIKVVTRTGISTCKVLLVSDDRDALSLLNEGHMDYVIRHAVESGVDPIQAIQMATLNTARRFGVEDVVGSISPGKSADVVLVEDLRSFRIRSVISKGELLIHNGRFLGRRPRFSYPSYCFRTIRFRRNPDEGSLVAKAPFGHATARAHVILVKDGSSLTKHLLRRVAVVEGVVQPDLSEDIVRVAVIERHGKTGNIGKGLVKGFGLRRGAVATSVGHDSHNLSVIGIRGSDMLDAIKAVRRMRGGIAVVDDGRVVAEVALPLAGLMSLRSLDALSSEMECARGSLRRLGCRLSSPFMTLSLLSLAVIPEIRITDKGLVDSVNMAFIPLVESAG